MLNLESVASKYTVQNLKDALIELYSKTDEDSFKAYQLTFDILEAKIGEDKMDQFLTAYGI